MAQHIPEFNNILVIHFGQLGDVILGLPALTALRKHFDRAQITALLGKPGADIVALANVADEIVMVDRVALRDGNKFVSIAKILALVKDIRRRKFDFVIDLNSLSETNLLGFLTGAKYRLYLNRENRSLDWLANFPVRPPLEDKAKHHTDRFLEVLQPLGITNAPRTCRVEPSDESLAEVKKYLASQDLDGRDLVGLFLGAGHPTRRWNIENFIELARVLSANDKIRVLVLFGPEERDLRGGLENKFGDTATIVPEMPLSIFYALLSQLKVLVSGDTGPMHLGAIAGARIVLLSEIGSPDIFRPLIDKLVVHDDKPLGEISVGEVANAVDKLLA
ncbi:MAG: glycosyltransferase family 9 protein [Pyrinomonadaceae bacterium]